MDIGKKIQDLGILAIPQDFLPLETADISDAWPNAYSAPDSEEADGRAADPAATRGCGRSC